MKPRIKLAKSWIDAGYRYEKWVCWTLEDSIYGVGTTPKEAHLDWIIRSLKA